MIMDENVNLPKSENQYIEFKSEFVKAMALAEEIIAFANSEDGEIWIEVDETVSGFRSTSFRYHGNRPGTNQ